MTTPHPRLAARGGLPCVSPKFAGPWLEAMGTDWTPGDAATDLVDRVRPRAEIAAR